jgi:hypothetical protein
MALDPKMEQRLRASGISPEEFVAGKPISVSDTKLKASKLRKKELVMRALRNGDPFPFIRYEWPELVITDKEELSDFAANSNRTDNLDLRIDDFQVDAIRSVFDRMHSRVLLSGGTKLGKGCIVGGIIVNTWFECHPDCKIILMGPDVEHVKGNLFAETCKWRKQMTSYQDKSDNVECLTERLNYIGRGEHYVMIANPKTGEGLSGRHSPGTLFVSDEASQLPDTQYTNALSQCASGMLIGISNPRQPSGWFWRAFKNHDHGCKTSLSESGPTRLISVGLVDCMNVRANRVAGIMAPPTGLTVGEIKLPGSTVIPENMRGRTRLLIPGQGCQISVATLVAECPANEIEWRVFGRFPKDNNAFDLFSPSWRDISQKRYNALSPKIKCRAAGIDVAASAHGDYCSIALGDLIGLKKILLIRNPNVPMLKGEIYARCRIEGMDLTDGQTPIGIDPLSMGGPLADFMEMDGCHIIRVGATSSAERNKDSYFNRRAEMYGDLAAHIDPQFTDTPWAINFDDEEHGEMIWQELRAHEKIYRPDGRKYQLNSKRKVDSLRKATSQNGRDSVEEKISRSPDRSDSVCFLHEAIMELPDYFGDVASQHDPSQYLREFHDCGNGEIQFEDWLGKTQRLPADDFFVKYGANPRVLA